MTKEQARSLLKLIRDPAWPLTEDQRVDLLFQIARIFGSEPRPNSREPQ